MKRNWTTFLLALAGILGFTLCRWTKYTAFDPSTHLALPQARSLPALTLFTVAVPVVVLLAALLLRRSRPQPARTTLYGPPGWPLSLMGTAAGVLFLVGAMGMASGNLTPLLFRRDITHLAGSLAGLALIGGAVAMLWLSAAGRREGARRETVLPLMIGFSLCMWLILFYHDNARDPVVTHYCWQLLTLMAAVLACYYQACLAFDQAKPLRCRVTTAIAAVYSLTSLPFAQSMPQLLLAAGLTLWMFQRSLLVLGGQPAKAT